MWLLSCMPAAEDSARDEGDGIQEHGHHQKRRHSTGKAGRKVAPAPKGISPEQTWIVLGLDNAGKSTLISSLQGTVEDIAPTVGFSKQQVKRNGQELRLFDVGGGKGIRGIWDSYYAEVHAVLFVVDAADVERFKEAREVLHAAFAHPTLENKPLLIIANKQDLDHAVGAEELEESLRLHELQTKSCHVTQGSANMGKLIFKQQKLQEGLDWITTKVVDDYSALEERRQRDIEEQAAADRKRKEERKARLEAKRKAREAEELANAAAAQSAGAPAPAVEGPTPPQNEAGARPVADQQPPRPPQSEQVPQPMPQMPQPMHPSAQPPVRPPAQQPLHVSPPAASGHARVPSNPGQLAPVKSALSPAGSQASSQGFASGARRETLPPIAPTVACQ